MNKTVNEYRTLCGIIGGVCNATNLTSKEMQISIQTVKIISKAITPEIADLINKPKFRSVKRHHARN